MDVVGRAHPPLDDVAPEARAHLVRLVVAEAARDQDDRGPGHKKKEARKFACAAVANEEEREQAEERARAVEHEGDAALRPAALKELVVDVLTVAFEQGPARDEAARDGEAGVYDGEREGHQGYGDRHRRRGLLRPRDGEGREQEADEERAGVAEEDRGRVKVVTKEAYERTGERKRDHGHERAARQERDREHHQRGEERRARRQPVEAVYQVEGVTHPDDPDECEDEAEDGRDCEGADEGDGDGLDATPQGVEQQARRRLRDELPAGLRAHEVVEDAEEEDERRRGEDGDRVTPVLLQRLRDEVADEGEPRERERDREEDRDASEAGGRGVVEKPADRRGVPPPERQRPAAGDGRQKEGRSQGDDEDSKVSVHRGTCLSYGCSGGGG